MGWVAYMSERLVEVKQPPVQRVVVQRAADAGLHLTLVGDEVVTMMAEAQQDMAGQVGKGVTERGRGNESHLPLHQLLLLVHYCRKGNVGGGQRASQQLRYLGDSTQTEL